MEPDIRKLVQIARRRWWVVLLLAIIGSSTAFAVATVQQDNYAATTTLLVISGQPGTSNDYTSLQASRSLAETYRLLIETGPVLQRVIDILDLDLPLKDLDEKVGTSVVGDTQLVEIRVEDPDPVLAALIANTIAEHFRTYITDQVDPRIGAQVEIADPARVPEDPFEPQPLQFALLGFVVGLLLGFSLAALLEFLDDTVKAEQNFQALAGAPLLTTVSELDRLDTGEGQLYALSQPTSGAAEALRLLRTNLEFASASGEIDAVTITSPGAGEGKSTIAANLGVVMAQAGLRTVVIDADLRKPTQARIFGVPNDIGLTTLLAHPEESWQDVARNVALSGLELIPSGPMPPNPSDLLSSARFEALLSSIMAATDIVIVDSPPVLAASDALSIAAHTDGVVMVCHSHRTRSGALKHAADAMHQGGIRLVGVVLNRLKGHQGASYYGQYYGTAETRRESAPVS